MRLLRKINILSYSRMKTYKQEYEAGKKSEDEVLPIIIKYFNRDIKASVGRYTRYDFEDSEYKYELKTRTNRYSQFPTTLLPLGKLTGDKNIFLFRFTDGLYFVEYSKELFDTFEVNDYVRNSRSDYTDHVAKHIFIPIQHLTKIN